MSVCQICGTKITTLRTTWLHLDDSKNDHKPEPKTSKKAGGS